MQTHGAPAGARNGDGDAGVDGPLVLIVEDNEKNLKLARDVLRAKGFQTVEATTGAEVLALARDHTPAVVLLDIQLPDMDGVEVLRRLREDEATRSLPVVALTAFAMAGDQERFLADGFDGYLTKPLDIRSFPDEVRRWCR